MRHLLTILILTLISIIATAETYVLANRQGVEGNRVFPSERMIQSNFNDAVLWMPSPSPTAWTNDFSSAHNDGTSAGDAAYSTNGGGCMSFDGAGDYLDLGSAWGNPGVDDFSVMAWVFFEHREDPQVILSKGRTSAGDFLFYNGNSALGLYGNAGSIDVRDSSAWPINAWLHVAVTRSNSVACLYFNGALMKTDTTAGGSMSNDHTWVIGACENGDALFMDGLIDDLRFYTRSLSATQITNFYDLTRGKYQND